MNFFRLTLLIIFLILVPVVVHAQVAEVQKLAAERGNVAAQRILGSMYATGEGVPKDFVEAARWYRKAAEQGDPAAQGILGSMYATGRGVPKTLTEAVGWYRKAAEQGNALAQGSLGLQYSKGEGVPKDFVLAYMWSNLAAAQDNEQVKQLAQKLRDLIKNEMTPAEVAEAQRLSREWKPTK